MHDNAAKRGMIYATVILLCYILGLILLFVHAVWKKHGQLSLYDIYFEFSQFYSVCQFSCTKSNNKENHISETANGNFETPSSGKINNVKNTSF